MLDARRFNVGDSRIFPLPSRSAPRPHTLRCGLDALEPYEGDDRNRTGVNGFAGRCVAIPPRRQVTRTPPCGRKISGRSGWIAICATCSLRRGYNPTILADVAQLARASACHAEGRGFESLHPLAFSLPVRTSDRIDQQSRCNSQQRHSKLTSADRFEVSNQYSAIQQRPSVVELRWVRSGADQPRVP